MPKKFKITGLTGREVDVIESLVEMEFLEPSIAGSPSEIDKEKRKLEALLGKIQKQTSAQLKRMK